MVLAQQQLEQDTLPSVSSEMDGEGDRQAERGEMSEGGGFGGPPEGGLSVRESDTSLSAPAVVLSSSSLTCVSSGKEGGEGKQRGHEMDVQPEGVLTHRISTADGRQSEGGGRVSLRESGRATVGVVGVAPASKNILVASAQSDSLYVSTGQSVSVNGVMGEKKGHDHFDDERCKFAPVCVDGQRGVGVLRGRSALTCGGVSVPVVHQSVLGQRDHQSSVCEGPKRRHLSSPSCAVSESCTERRGGERAFEAERGDMAFSLLSVPQQYSPLSKCSRMQHDEGKMEGWLIRACQTGRMTVEAIKAFCPSDSVCTDCAEYAGAQRGYYANRKRLFTSSTDAEQQHQMDGQRDGGSGRREVNRTGKQREGTGEVKRDRHGKILCPHGRQRSRCKDCGGVSICEHGRQRRNCKECGGNGICEHGRHRFSCKECGGASICLHGRIRSQCKDCGGGSICVHGRQRSQCKDCGGASICKHGRQRNTCKDCGGKSFCEHGRKRYYCKDCGGGGICEHGRERYFCKECGGKGICVHQKRRRDCKECKLVSSLPH
uniref:CR-type domain-containing protein n=1 Tax=Chromera velia CCMP2878 TaxID=1169474 RepID=A0A0G4GKP8_9ALVE|eukprot:Cvel_22351.t1-p1 / transcript=Cvel_22351.t1 / gene=Cvel_22351 / organism=Chromera_velia_CCMP2878 / gene_product=Zinc finger protein 283, putative / transcript_product=Zinc finger protein 283, putative / location=Cvel_scaffold2188:31310-32941(-) / protein_length=544 / sequence_SO=supercontig / SO=protein_coding / is_pseudo=false